MRVAFIGKNHAYSLIPFAALAEGHEVVGVIESGARSSAAGATRWRTALRNLRAALSPGSPRGWSLRRGVPFFWLERESLPGLGDFIRSCRPDVIVVASLSFLLPESVLRIPRHGALNLHPSLLPRYHGPFPWVWQYLADERETGITVHQLDAGQDTGPILAQRALPLPRGIDVAELQQRVAKAGGELLLEVLGALAAGRASVRRQDHGDLPKARVVRRDEELIDWCGWPIERVWHALRGCYPWLDPPRCPPSLQGGRYRVAEYEPGDPGGPPGATCRDSRGWFVAHPEGRIRIHPLRPLIPGLRWPPRRH